MPQIIAFVFRIGLRIVLQNSLDHSLAFKVCVNRKIFGISDFVYIRAKYASAHRVKRACPHVRISELFFYTLFHLVRRFVRERDCKNVVRAYPDFYQMTNARCEYARFSAACACDDEYRSVNRFDSELLLFVEFECRVHNRIIRLLMRRKSRLSIKIIPHIVQFINLFVQNTQNIPKKIVKFIDLKK